MGKSQKRRAARRHNPVRVPDSHLPKGLDAAAATSSRKDEVLPIIRKLESVDAQERTWACSAVSNLIQNDPSTRRLLQGKDIVGALITRLSDNIEEVVVEASGALRNLCIDAGYDVCAEMYNKNILAPLQTFIPKISSALHHLVNSPKSAAENASQLAYDLAENVITILWCLSETSNKALNAVNAIHLVGFLMGFLENKGKLPSRTVAAAAQCLYVLSDDNPPAIDELRSNSSYTSCLLSIARGDATPTSPILPSAEMRELAEDRLLTVQLLAAGILRNIQPIPAPSAASTVDIDRGVVFPLVLPVLTSISLSDASEHVMGLVRQEEQEPKIELEKPSLKKTPKSDHKTHAERGLEKVEAKLRNLQLGLEILTGVCATLPDPESDLSEGDAGDADIDAEDVDAGESENDDPEDKEDVEMDVSEPELEIQVNGSTTPAASFLPTILPPLLTLIQPTPLSFPPVYSSANTTALLPPVVHLPTTSALSAIHISALECLNNTCLALALAQEESGARASVKAGLSDVEDGQRLWSAIWSALAAVGLEGGRGQERRREMWEVAVGVLWGIGGIWKGSIAPEEEQVKLLTQLCDASTDPQVRVKCIGALECLAQHPSSVEANHVISDYLLTILTSSSSSPEPIFQAASALIDIYSDETRPYDINFRQYGYLDALSQAVKNVRRAVKSVDEKKEGGRALKARGEETLENLQDFIRYRKNLKL